MQAIKIVVEGPIRGNDDQKSAGALPMTAPSDKATGPLLLDLATVTVLNHRPGVLHGWAYAYHYFGYFKLVC